MNEPVPNRWKLYPEQNDLSAEIGRVLDCNPVIAHILLNRDIRSITQAKNFLDPSLEIDDNFDLDKLETITKILADILQEEKHIMVFGDYDVDGITSTSLMVSVLRQAGANVDYYIPHRFTEGYGLNLAFADKFIEGKHDLLITIDCGISNIKEIKKIKELTDKTVIVLDHHNIPDELPPADIILNSKYFDETHNLRHLCSAGVVYKVLEFCCKKLKPDINIEDNLDLVALGTVADIMSLKGVNRKFVRFGLKRISARKRKGIRYLLEEAGFKQEFVTTRDLGFVLGPRLNASGRLSHANIAVELLLTDDDNKAKETARKINKLNNERREIERIVTKSAIETLEQESHQDENILVVTGYNWHPGVIGITASRLVDKFSKPVVVISHNGNTGMASARTIGNLNIYKYLKECSDYFIKFGGHKQAAGFSIAFDKIDAFKKKLQSSVRGRISKEELRPVVYIDYKIGIEQITKDLINDLKSLEPFGEGNPSPVFYSNKFIPVDFKKVGDGSHLKATFTDPDGKFVIDAIGFKLSDKMHLLYNKNIELIFNLEMNEWNGRTLPQLQVVDLK